MLIAPSLLACDFAHLADEVKQAEDGGADWLHIDVMDGCFVPNITFGPVMVQAIRRVTKLPLDVHLMIDHPETYMRQFLDAGSDYLTPHIEAAGFRDRAVTEATLRLIRDRGAKTGLAIKPKTGIESLSPHLASLDLALVMTVEPGFGGQAFISEAVPKIPALRRVFAGLISVDGGITVASGAQCRAAGADVLVAGTTVFRSPCYRDAIASLRQELAR